MYKTKKGARVSAFEKETRLRFADTVLWILENDKEATKKLSGTFHSQKTYFEYLNAFRFAQQIRFSVAQGNEIDITQYKGREKQFEAVIARIKSEGQQQRIFNH